MERLSPLTEYPLYDAATLRQIEQAALQRLPAHTLMRRAGLAVAKLAVALAPHARRIWIACGPGNNGGDGFEAAIHLHRWGKQVCVSWAGDAERSPADALASLRRARKVGVVIGEHPPRQWDLVIDALLGIGARRAPSGVMAQWVQAMQEAEAPVLAVDVPSGLLCDTGQGAPAADDTAADHPKTIANHPEYTGVRAQYTLSLLGLKPGLFTALGRDLAGEVWHDALGVDPLSLGFAPCAYRQGQRRMPDRSHASHKGSFGDVAVVGGAPGMQGAALLAAQAALHGGAGRVFAALLDPAAEGLHAAQPELMFRTVDSLALSQMSVVCGCGGGTAVDSVLPKLLPLAQSLVLDADALNALARDADLQASLRRRADRGQATVLTPHPLEAARLLACATREVQSDRLAAAQRLAERFHCVVALKGSGTVIAAPGVKPRINPTGNARLATAGTGDVLAGMVGAGLAQGLPAWLAACEAVFQHGAVAEHWPSGQMLTAGTLARAAHP